MHPSPLRVTSSRPSPDDHRPEEVIGPPAFSVGNLLAGLFKLASYKDLIYTLTLVRLQVRYKQSILGWIWAVAQPLALMLAYTLIFSVLGRIPSEGVPYPAFTLAALLPWTVFASSVNNATGGMVHFGYLLTKVYFPREIIPFTYVLAALFDFVVQLLVLTGILLYYHVQLTARILYVIPIIFCVALFSAGIALLLSAWQVHFRDVGVAMPLILQVWMLASPVVYPLRSVPAGWRQIYLLNPLAGLVENFRRAVIPGLALDWGLFAVSALLSGGAFLLCYAVFKHLDSTLADVI